MTRKMCLGACNKTFRLSFLVLPTVYTLSVLVQSAHARICNTHGRLKLIGVGVVTAGARVLCAKQREDGQIKMGVVFSMLWRLDATAACVALFVVALGSLWLCVALAKPSHSSREHERLEELLGESAVATSSAAGGGGRREGKKGRGRGKTVSSCIYALFTLCSHSLGGGGVC